MGDSASARTATSRRDFLSTVWRSAAGLSVASSGLLTRGCGGGPGGLGHQPPDIVLIVADDLGYADLSCYGSSRIDTPNIDQIAQEGVRLTDCYTCAPMCTPSRAGLLTGRYPARYGLTRALVPPSTEGLPDAEVTLAEALKAAGYATALIGKWHLGGQPEHFPNRHGFDHFYGPLWSNDHTPFCLYRDEQIVTDTVSQERLTQQYTSHAVEFIKSCGSKPLFLYLCHSMPHVPLSVSSRFAGRSAGGLYGDVVECIDWSMGQILRAINGFRRRRDTFIAFTSDNGPAVHLGQAGGSARPLREGKYTVFEGGVRVPLVASYPREIRPRRVCTEPLALMDLFPTCLALAGAPRLSASPIDAHDIRPVLSGQAPSPHELLFFYNGPRVHAVRWGPWKLHLWRRLRRPSATVRLDPPELYHLGDDIGETRDLSDEQADVVSYLLSEVASWEAQVPTP